ncbi:hypothetical protein SHL15_0816 [Streptomyces hygroscopicus subsp. limoneus]|nr:hypothetical protein SHL15_0816 [Streptomyces hygroscopicus subsp. limoneus]
MLSSDPLGAGRQLGRADPFAQDLRHELHQPALAVTGALVSAGIGHPWGFYFFATVAALAFPAVLTLPARPPRDPAA